MLTLTNPVQVYAWGEVDGLARLVGTPPTGGPEAELWVGAHPAAPSVAEGRGGLDQVVADDPRGICGPEVAARFDGRFPFMLKVLAIGGPLSIQLHPSADQARAGFDREEASGPARDDPRRTYRDPYAKPEILVALEPTSVLAGLRTGADAAARLAPFGRTSPAVADLARRVEAEPDARAALVGLLSASGPARDALVAAAAASDPGDGPAHRVVAELAEAHPDDPTALAPLLLELRHLDPGRGLFLPAGVPHAYLRGAGVEVLGASDNVVRGGLTAKHVDRDELVRLLAPPGRGAVELPGLRAAGGVTTYAPAVPELALVRAPLSDGSVALDHGPPGPALVVAIGGEATVHVEDQEARLAHGSAALVTAEERGCGRVSGTGTAWWATPGSPCPS